MYSQLQGQMSSMENAMKEREGTIETLERQLVQAGIKMKVGDASINPAWNHLKYSSTNAHLFTGIVAPATTLTSNLALA